MKLRPTQFGVRENTASSRQHAPRFGTSHTQLLPSNTSGGSYDDERHLHISHAISAREPSLIEAANAATGGVERDGSHLLTVQDVADLLQVPISWVYEHTRPRCSNPLPCIKLGKYLRFRSNFRIRFPRPGSIAQERAQYSHHPDRSTDTRPFGRA